MGTLFQMRNVLQNASLLQNSEEQTPIYKATERITFQTRYWQVKLIYLNQLERYFALTDSYSYQRCRIRKPSQQDGKMVLVLNKFTNNLNYIWCSQYRKKKKIREVLFYDNFSLSKALKTAR